jgi:hypothetical protein
MTRGSVPGSRGSVPEPKSPSLKAVVEAGSDPDDPIGVKVCVVKEIVEIRNGGTVAQEDVVV